MIIILHIFSCFSISFNKNSYKQTNSVALSPRANYSYTLVNIYYSIHEHCANETDIQVVSLWRETWFPVTVECLPNSCWKWICEVRATRSLNSYGYATWCVKRCWVSDHRKGTFLFRWITCFPALPLAKRTYLETLRGTTGRTEEIRK
jgi:hypothetical protein